MKSGFAPSSEISTTCGDFSAVMVPVVIVIMGARRLRNAGQ
jgi:hypothetical protein